MTDRAEIINSLPSTKPTYLVFTNKMKPSNRMNLTLTYTDAFRVSKKDTGASVLRVRLIKRLIGGM